jgi:hypothetical protein
MGYEGIVEAPRDITCIIKRIAVLETRMDEFREQMRIRKEEGERALALQTDEFKRRLTELNGEAERLRKMQATYLPREVFDVKVRHIEVGILSILLALVGLFGTVVIAWVQIG